MKPSELGISVSAESYDKKNTAKIAEWDFLKKPHSDFSYFAEKRIASKL